MTDVSTTCAVVIFSCITSVDGIKLWLLTWSVNYVALLCQLCRDVFGCEDSQCHWCVLIWLLSQLSCRLLLVKLSLVQSFCRSKFCLIPLISRLYDAGVQFDLSHVRVGVDSPRLLISIWHLRRAKVQDCPWVNVVIHQISKKLRYPFKKSCVYTLSPK